MTGPHEEFQAALQAFGQARSLAASGNVDASMAEFEAAVSRSQPLWEDGTLTPEIRGQAARLAAEHEVEALFELLDP